MILVATAATCLILFTTWGGNTYAWGSGVIIGLIVGCIVTVAFVFVEKRADEPVIPMHLFAQRNFVLTTVAGLIIGIAMFGALAYLPTYIQMVTERHRSRTDDDSDDGGPTRRTHRIRSAGQQTGRYKIFPIVGTSIVALALVLLSRSTPSTSLLVFGCYIALMGIGLGLGHADPDPDRAEHLPGGRSGTATASNNFFRQIGASLGSAIVGSLFACA